MRFNYFKVEKVLDDPSYTPANNKYATLKQIERDLTYGWVVLAVTTLQDNVHGAIHYYHMGLVSH